MVGKVKLWVGRMEKVTRDLGLEGWFWLCLTFFCLLSASYASAAETGREVVAAWPFWLVAVLCVAGWALTIFFTVLAGRAENDELDILFLGFLFGPVAAGFFAGICLGHVETVPRVWCGILTVVCAFALWVVAYEVERYINSRREV